MAKKRFLRAFRKALKMFGVIRAGANRELDGAGYSFHRLEQFAHFWTLVWKSFVRNCGLIRASALAFSTLLAFIPMLAVTIGITSSLLKTEGPQKIESLVQTIVNHVIPPATLESSENSTAPIKSISQPIQSSRKHPVI